MRSGSGRRNHPQKRKGVRGDSRRNAGGERSDAVVLYGWHPVIEALRNQRRTHLRLLATENGARRLRAEFQTLPLEPEVVQPREIDRLLTPDAVHQGLYLLSEPLDGPDLDAIPDNSFLVVLDQVTDPHNVGAIVRSCAAFGVDAIITTERHSPTATGVLAKAASGGLEHVPVISVRNLGNALEALGRQGVMRVGLDSEGERAIDDIVMRAPLAIVLGAEGKGLRQRTRETCDFVARLDMPGAVKSLNVSNAAAIGLFVAHRSLRYESKK